jgi:hypothetical protein
MKEVNKKILEMITTYETVFNSPNGKKVFQDLKKSFGGPCFDPNPFVMAYKEGCREVLLRIEAMIRRSKNKALVEQLSKDEEERE